MRIKIGVTMALTLAAGLSMGLGAIPGGVGEEFVQAAAPIALTGAESPLLAEPEEDRPQPFEVAALRSSPLNLLTAPALAQFGQVEGAVYVNFVGISNYDAAAATGVEPPQGQPELTVNFFSDIDPLTGDALTVGGVILDADDNPLVDADGLDLLDPNEDPWVSGDPVAWLWDFGDGTTSNEQNPVHTYAELGAYTVTLTVTFANLNPPGAEPPLPAGSVQATEEKQAYVAVDLTAEEGALAATLDFGDVLLNDFALLPLHDWMPLFTLTMTADSDDAGGVANRVLGQFNYTITGGCWPTGELPAFDVLSSPRKQDILEFGMFIDSSADGTPDGELNEFDALVLTWANDGEPYGELDESFGALQYTMDFFTNGYLVDAQNPLFDAQNHIWPSALPDDGAAFIVVFRTSPTWRNATALSYTATFGAEVPTLTMVDPVLNDPAVNPDARTGELWRLVDENGDPIDTVGDEPFIEPPDTCVRYYASFSVFDQTGALFDSQQNTVQQVNLWNWPGKVYTPAAEFIRPRFDALTQSFDMVTGETLDLRTLFALETWVSVVGINVHSGTNAFISPPGAGDPPVAGILEVNMIFTDIGGIGDPNWASTPPGDEPGNGGFDPREGLDRFTVSQSNPGSTPATQAWGFDYSFNGVWLFADTNNNGVFDPPDKTPDAGVTFTDMPMQPGLWSSSGLVDDYEPLWEYIPNPPWGGDPAWKVRLRFDGLRRRDPGETLPGLGEIEEIPDPPILGSAPSTYIEDYFVVFRADSGYQDVSLWPGDGTGLDPGADFRAFVEPRRWNPTLEWWDPITGTFPPDGGWDGGILVSNQVNARPFGAAPLGPEDIVDLGPWQAHPLNTWPAAGLSFHSMLSEPPPVGVGFSLDALANILRSYTNGAEKWWPERTLNQNNAKPQRATVEIHDLVMTYQTGNQLAKYHDILYGDGLAANFSAGNFFPGQSDFVPIFDAWIDPFGLWWMDFQTRDSLDLVNIRDGGLRQGVEDHPTFFYRGPGELSTHRMGVQLWGRFTLFVVPGIIVVHVDDFRVGEQLAYETIPFFNPLLDDFTNPFGPRSPFYALPPQQPALPSFGTWPRHPVFDPVTGIPLGVLDPVTGDPLPESDVRLALPPGEYPRKTDWRLLQNPALRPSARLLTQYASNDDPPTAVMGINLVGADDPVTNRVAQSYLEEITVAFWGPDFTPGDLRNLDPNGTNPGSGVLLYEDSVSGSGGFAGGVFFATDTIIDSLVGADTPIALSNLGWPQSAEPVDLDGDGFADDMDGDGNVNENDYAWVLRLRPRFLWPVPISDERYGGGLGTIGGKRITGEGQLISLAIPADTIREGRVTEEFLEERRQEVLAQREEQAEQKQATKALPLGGNAGDDLFVVIRPSAAVTRFESFRTFVPATLPSRPPSDRRAGIVMSPDVHHSPAALERRSPEESAVQDWYGHDMLKFNIPSAVVSLVEEGQTVAAGAPPLAVLAIDVATNRDPLVATPYTYPPRAGQTDPGAIITLDDTVLTVEFPLWEGVNLQDHFLIDEYFESYEITSNENDTLHFRSGTPNRGDLEGRWIIARDPSFLEQVIVEFYDEGLDGAFNIHEDLAPLGHEDPENGLLSGVALYRDNLFHPQNTVGVFDPPVLEDGQWRTIDLPVRLDDPPVRIGLIGEPNNQVKFVFSSPGTDNLPVNLDEQERLRQWIPDRFGRARPGDAPDFFVVVRVSSNMTPGDDFRVGLVSWGPTTPSEPDPDTFTDPPPPIQPSDEFDIFSEFPWGLRALGFITFMYEPPLYYFMMPDPDADPIVEPAHRFKTWQEQDLSQQALIDLGLLPDIPYWIRSGSTKSEQTPILTAIEGVSADFTAVPIRQVPNGDIQFTSLADPADVQSYLWGFSDGQTSTDANPLIAFARAGLYDVTLTVTDFSGVPISVRKPEFIWIIDPALTPFAEFVAAPREGILVFDDDLGDAGFEVAFTDLSQGGVGNSILSWVWDFGDGSALGSGPAPVHRYTTEGLYTVTLTVVFQEPRDTRYSSLSRPGYILVLPVIDEPVGEGEGEGEGTPDNCQDFDGFGAPIADNATTSFVLDVPADLVIEEVQVTINVDHFNIGQLGIFLVSPDGTEVVLVNRINSNGNDFANTTFDDDADTGILEGDDPYSGSFVPEGNLEDFNGESSQGRWVLRIIDYSSVVDEGVLNSWTLEVCGPDVADVEAAMTFTVEDSIGAGDINRDGHSLVPLNDWVPLFNFNMSAENAASAGRRFLKTLEYAIVADPNASDRDYTTDRGGPGQTDLLEFGLFEEMVVGEDGALDGALGTEDIFRFSWDSSGRDANRRRVGDVSGGPGNLIYTMDIQLAGQLAEPRHLVSPGVDPDGRSYIVAVRTSPTWRHGLTMSYEVRGATMVDRNPVDEFTPDFTAFETFTTDNAYSSSFTVYDISSGIMDQFDPDFANVWHTPLSIYTPHAEFTRPRFDLGGNFFEAMTGEFLNLRQLFALDTWVAAVGINVHATPLPVPSEHGILTIVDGDTVTPLATLREVNVVFTDIGGDPDDPIGNGGFDPREGLERMHLPDVAGEFTDIDTGIGRDTAFNGVWVFHDTNGNGTFDPPTPNAGGVGVTFTDYPMMDDPALDEFGQWFQPYEWEYIANPPWGGDPAWKMRLRLHGLARNAFTVPLSPEGSIEPIPTDIEGDLGDGGTTDRDYEIGGGVISPLVMESGMAFSTPIERSDYFVVFRSDSGFIDISGEPGDGVGLTLGADFRVFIEPRRNTGGTGPADWTGGIYVTNMIPPLDRWGAFSALPFDHAWQNDSRWGPTEPWWPERTLNAKNAKPFRSVVEVHDLVMTYEPDNDVIVVPDVPYTSLFFARWNDPAALLLASPFLNGHAVGVGFLSFNQTVFVGGVPVYISNDRSLGVHSPFETTPFFSFDHDPRSQSYPTLHQLALPALPDWSTWPGPTATTEFPHLSDWVAGERQARLLQQRIDSESEPTALLGFNLVGTADPQVLLVAPMALEAITVAFWGPDFDRFDLLPIDREGGVPDPDSETFPGSGVMLWADTADQAFDGAFGNQPTIDFSDPAFLIDSVVPLRDLAWPVASELIDLDGDGIADDMNGDGVVDDDDRALVLTLVPATPIPLPQGDSDAAGNSHGDDLFLVVRTSDRLSRFEQFRAVVPATLPDRPEDRRAAGVRITPQGAVSPSALTKLNPEEGPVHDFFSHDMLEANVPVKIVDLVTDNTQLTANGSPRPIFGLDISTNQSGGTVETGTAGVGTATALTDSTKNWVPDAFADKWLVDSNFVSFRITANTSTRLDLDLVPPPDPPDLLDPRPAEGPGPYRIVQDPTFFEQLIVEFLPSDESSTFSLFSDLLPLSATQAVSGVAIYRDNDNHPSNTNGVFDIGIDIPLTLDAAPVLIGAVGEPNQVKFVFSSPGTDDWPVNQNAQARNRQWVPDTWGATDASPFFGLDFFVVVRGSSRLTVDDSFQAAIVSWGPATPTEPDPDTFVSPTPPIQSGDEFNKYSEFPWGSRALGFITYFENPPTRYWLTGNRASSEPSPSVVNWVRTTTSKKILGSALSTEGGGGGTGMTITNVTFTTLPDPITAGDTVTLTIRGENFGPTPTVAVGNFAVQTINDPTGQGVELVVILVYTGTSPLTGPVTLSVTNPNTAESLSVEDVFDFSGGGGGEGGPGGGGGEGIGGPPVGGGCAAAVALTSPRDAGPPRGDMLFMLCAAAILLGAGKRRPLPALDRRRTNALR